jgi:hypothetical protein
MMAAVGELAKEVRSLHEKGGINLLAICHRARQLVHGTQRLFDHPVFLFQLICGFHSTASMGLIRHAAPNNQADNRLVPRKQRIL